MKYLATIQLQKCLAPLPQSICLAEPNVISGVMGSKRRDLSALREPFHREYANCTLDRKAILMFTRQYGLLDWEGQFAGRTDLAGLKFTFHVEEWREHRANFLSAWATTSRNQKGLNWSIVPDTFPMPSTRSAWMVFDHNSLIVKGPKTLWTLTEKGPVARVYAQTSWEYLWMLLCFEQREKLRSCENPKCAAPYFIARRKDQRFCGEDCAHLIAASRWWTQHGKEWRRRRASRKAKR